MKKRFIALLCLILALLAGCSPRLSPSENLRLLPEREESAVSLGVPLLNTEEHIPYMEAFPSGRFLPEVVMRRGEVCQILFSLMANPVEGSCSFSDVRPGSPYYESVACLTAWGIVSDSTGEFHPNDLISWAQLLTMLSRFYPTPQEGEAPYIGSFLGRRADLAEPEILPGIISFAGIDKHWAFDAIENSVARDWLEPGGSFFPDAPVTRAEFCRLLNAVLGRQCDEAYVLISGQYAFFPDVSPSHPDFGDIMEASRSHTYYTDDNGIEIWSDQTLDPGFHRACGHLYFVNEEGRLLRNENLSVWTFDATGRYTTGLPELDQKILEVFDELGTDDMSRSQALKTVYRYVVDHDYIHHPSRVYGFADNRKSLENDRLRALHFLNVGSGVCYDYAAAFGFMARALGYEAYMVSGWLSIYRDAHGWVVIPENGTDYIYDTQMESNHPERHGDLDLFRTFNWEIYSYWPSVRR